MSSSVAELKAVNAAQVCLILGLALILAGSVVGLAALGKDVVTILTGVAAVAITVAGAFGWAKANQLVRNFNQVSDNIDQVRELSNGRLTEVLEANRKLHEQVTALAMMVQPGTPPPEQK